MPKLVIQLVTWNGSKYIKFLFESLRNQTFRDWSLLILDNGSTDDTVELIKKEMNNLGVQSKMIENKENLGFAGGHNKLMRFSSCHSERSEESLGVIERDPSTPLRSAQDDKEDYLLLLNQDMYLMPDCLEKLVKFMDEHSEAAAISPRLMKWNFNRLQDSGYKLQDSFTNQIDSLGLKVFRSRRVVELGAGKEWDKNVIKGSFVRPGRTQDDVAMEVFGVSGALPMFRKSVIEKVGLFDESFGSYKEDVDLAFRLRSAGYRSFVVLDAVAYHDRSAAGVEKTGDLAAIENKTKQSKLIKYNSYKNHLMTLIKNEYWQNYFLDLPWIKWYELKKFVYFFLFDRGVLRGLGEIWKNRRDLKIKRLKIKELRKAGWREMRKWW